MKKLLALLLAVGMVAGTGALTAFARDDDDDEYDNLDFFEIKDTNKGLYPGQDYYFETDWKGSPIDDDFFEYYRVSISVKSDDDDVSSLKVRNRIDKAEFVKDEQTGAYYFHIRANTSFSYDDDLAVLIRVLAKDKENSDTRSWYEMNLDVDYSDIYLAKEKDDDDDDRSVVKSSQYDVNNYSPAVEFDKDLDQCRIDFDDGSYGTLRLSGNSRKFNFGYADIANPFVVKANPKASLHFRSFYGRPQFANEEVFKLKVPTDKKYLYEIGEDNALTLVSQDNNKGYFGFTTQKLGSYVASNLPLNSPSTSVGVSVSKVNSDASAAPPASAAPTGSVGALQNLLTRNFSNKFALMNNGSEYGLLDKAATFSVSISLEGMDPADLYLYTYDEANNRLIQSSNRPKAGADGKVTFTTNTKGYYVVSSGKLAK